MKTFWTVVGVIAAIAIAWFVVEVLLRLAVFAVKFGLIAVVAIVVFFVLRWLFSRGSDRQTS